MSLHEGGIQNSTLNEHQRRNLRANCDHMDALLQQVEDVLNPVRSHSVFPKYIHDFAPVEQKTIEDYIARIRTQLLRVLAGQAIEVEKPRITASHAIHSALTFVEVAIEELSPDRMRGYGPVSEAGVADLNGAMQELAGVVQQLHRYVLWRGALDVRARLARVDGPEGELALLRRIEEIVARRGLVEFRSTLLMLLDRLEDTAFEIAIFGRVSSGKSSLLNHLIGADVLPVGVTPITAVPTRVAYGSEAGVRVWIEGTGAEDCELSRLPEFVDERLNRGNVKRVARVAVRCPSDRLREGIVLVDTPGLGSLATSGAAETMAYLPRCDAGIVLVDAASVLTPEDLKVMWALSASSIPVTVLLSKADLLNHDDLERVQEYVHEHVLSELGMDVEVYPVSIVTSHSELLENWVQRGMNLLYANHKELCRESISRKIAALQDFVRAALKAELQSALGPQEHRADLQQAETELRRVSGVLQTTAVTLRKIVDRMNVVVPEILQKAAEDAALRWKAEPSIDLGEVLCSSAETVTSELVKDLRHALDEATESLHAGVLLGAAALQADERPVPKEPLVAHEMPRLDMTQERLPVSRPLAAKLAGRAALRRHAEKELSVLRPGLEQAVYSYAFLLRGWSERTLAEVERQFNRYADRYRAQLDRLLSVRSVSEEERRVLKSDLELLGGAVVASETGTQLQAS